MEMAVSLSVRLFATNSIPSAGGTGRCNYTEIAEWFESIGVGQRALPIRVFTVGKKRSPAVQLLVDEYTSKLRRYCAVEDVQVRSNPRNAREKQAQIVDEDVAVMNLIKPDDWVVLLDEQGIDIESEEMAELIGGAADKVMDNPEGAKVSSLAIPPAYLRLLLMWGVDFLCSAHPMHS
ncbi:putative RNA methyltransferase At5g10620 isoform X5 [Eucalyptus grandis]|uniref:putative RNA methyltransferase At5g10620 isoform X5 n=1 Tax=Eucalyptus grandis TaxID=71139 RepID=UPI00052631D7|nr:putative RNA methyltransferase At5g10620 isoform X5 [Eucalyptus grandis]XP_039166077.1 putative RNA methyltransferase At5g10620 isoform X5 [Eucalyptus grandis]